MLAKLLQTEPARLISIAASLLGVAVAYGLVSQARVELWIGVATVLLPFLLPLIQGALTRETVYSPDTVQKIADAATKLAPGTSVDIGSPPDASPPLPPDGNG